MLAEIARITGATGACPGQVERPLLDMIEEGSQVRAVDYLRAQEGIARLSAGLELLSSASTHW
jgi:hypothetical protein